MTTQRGRHRKLRRNILHTVIATALLAGTFTVVDQTVNSPTASANEAGKVDSTFTPITGAAQSIAAFSDNSFVVGYSSGTFVKRFDSTGAPLTLTTAYPVSAVALEVDRTNNNFVVGGSGGGASHRARLYSQSGSLLSLANSNNIEALASSAVKIAGSSIYLGGGSTSYWLGKFSSTLTADSTFNGNVEATRQSGNAIAIDSSSRVYFGGNYTTGVKRRTTTGAVDSTFTASTNPGTVSALEVDSTDSVIVGTSTAPYLYKYSSSGALDTNFANSLGAAFGGKISSIKIHNNMIYVGGEFTGGLKRLYLDGTPDAVFNSNVASQLTNTVKDIEIDPAGRVLVAYGAGVKRFVTADVSVPAAPTISSTVAKDSSMQFSLTSTDAANTSRIVVSTVGLNPEETCSITGTTGSCAISGLTNGTSYNFEAKSYNGGVMSSGTLSTGTPLDLSPAIQSASIDPTGKVVSLVFDQAISTTTAQNTDFVVTLNGQAINSSSGISGIATSGATLNITLVNAIPINQYLTISYASPSVNNDLSNLAIQDASGNDSQSFTNFPITNNSTVADTVAPILSSAVLQTNGTQIVLTYNEPLGSQSNAVERYSVCVNAVCSRPASVTLSTDPVVRSVTLALSSGVVAGATVTLTYTQSASNHVKDVAGNKAADFANQLVTNNSTFDNVKPVFSSAATNVEGTKLILTYNESLNSATAGTGAFAVVSGGSTNSVTAVSVVGSTVELTLNSIIQKNQIVTVAYTAPTANVANSNSAIQDTTGNDAVALSATSVTNNSIIDTVAPVYSSSAVNEAGTRVILTYNEALNATTAASSDFTVLVGGVANTVTSTAVVGSTIELTLTNVVQAQTVVTVSYTAPSSSNSASNMAIQDTVGNDSLSLATTTVTNGSTQDQTPPVLTSASVGTSGTSLVLFYNESLNTVNKPAASSYVVTVDGTPVTVSTVTVNGSTVTLALGSTVNGGQDVTVAYTPPTPDTATTNPAIQDTTGNDALSIANTFGVTNGSTQGPPGFLSGSVNANGTSATIVFSKGVALSSAWASNLTLYANGMAVKCSTLGYGTPANSFAFSGCTPTIPAGATVTASWEYPTSTPFPDQTARSFTEKPLTNSSTQPGDVTAPTLTSITMPGTNGQTIVLTYDEAMGGVVPTGDMFTVLVNGTASTVSSVSVVGQQLTLTMSPPIELGQNVSVAYTPPTPNSRADAAAIQDVYGNDAAAIAATSVPNTSTAVVDRTAPVFQSAATNTNGTQIILTYDEALSSTTAAPSSYSITLNGMTFSPTAVSISGSTVILTVGTNIVSGESVAVSYTAPTSSGLTSNSATQDLSGNDAATLTSTVVTNNSNGLPDLTPPAVSTVAYSGTQVTLTLNEPLSSTSAGAGQYTVFVGNTPVTPSAVAILGQTVVLTLPSSIPAGTVVAVSYTAPLPAVSNTSNQALQDLRGNDAASFNVSTQPTSSSWEWVGGTPTGGCPSAGGAYVNSTKSKLLPNGVTYTVAVTGDNLCIAEATESLSERGGRAGDFTSTGLVTEPGLKLWTSNDGCISGVLCENRGVMTVSFSKPVTNPIVSFAGWGGGSDGASWSEMKLLTPGATVTALSGTNIQISQLGTYIENVDGKIPTTKCHDLSNGYGGNAGAVCGSLQINGTYTSVSFRVNQSNFGGVGYEDAWNLTASIPEDFGLVPTSYDTPVASHAIGNLKLGAVVTADQASSLYATTNADAVASGTEIKAGAKNVSNGDVVIDDGVAQTEWNGLVDNRDGETFEIDVTLAGVTETANLCAWIDFNRDGVFTAGERACATSPTVGQESAKISWTIPNDIVSGPTYARVRLSYDALALPSGKVGSGEVEDYSLTIASSAIPSAVTDNSIAGKDVNQTISPLANDQFQQGFGNDMTKMFLCLPNQTPMNCTVGVGQPLTISGEGTYTLNADGTVTFDPVSTFTGTATPIKYQIADTSGRTSSSTINPVVIPTPIGVQDTSSGEYDKDQLINPLTNDVPGSPNYPIVGSTLKLCQVDDPATTGTNEAQSPNNCTATSVTIPGEGTYTLNSDGTVTFNPLSTFYGTVATPVKYQAQDTLGQFENSTIRPTVAEPPAVIATNDTSSGNYDINQTIQPLRNDISDGNEQTLLPETLMLCQVDDPATTGTNEAQSPNNCTATSVTIPGEGTYTVNSDGTVTFNPLPTFTDTVTTPVVYQVTDALGRKVSANITPTVGLPPIPTALPETTSGPFNTAQSTTPLTNETPGSASFPLSKTEFKLCAITESPNDCSATSVTFSGEGTYTYNDITGEITFTPLASFVGEATPISYQSKDSLNRFISSTYTPEVLPPPPPTADDETSTGAFNTPQAPIDVLLGDTPGNSSAPLDPDTLRLCDPSTTPPQTGAACTETSVITADGTYEIVDGKVVFTPANNFHGVATPIDYIVEDSLGQIAQGTITPTVNKPTPPTADPETKSVLPGQSVSFTTITGANGLASGTQLQTTGANKTCLFTTNTTICDADNSITIVGEGTYTLDPTTGVVTFAADANATSAPKTPITYRVTDVTGQSATDTLTPIIPPPPTADDETDTVPFNTAKQIDVLLGDTPGDPSAPLVPATLKLCGANESSPNCTKDEVTVPEGIYRIVNGKVEFTPNTNFSGPVTPIDYIVEDSLGQVAEGTITLTVPIPPAPTAKPDVTSGSWNTPQSINVVDNTSGNTGDDVAGTGATLIPSSVVLSCGAAANCSTATVNGKIEVTIANQGTYSLGSNGEVIFTPLSTFKDTATPVTYTVSDNAGQTATTTYTPTVAAPPAPMADPETTSGIKGATQTIDLIPGDTTFDPAITLVRASVALSCKSGVANCSVANNKVTIVGVGTYEIDPANPGHMLFTPEPNFTGVGPAVNYTVTDSMGGTASSTYTPTVIPPPTVVSDTTSAGWNVTQSIDVVTSTAGANTTNTKTNSQDTVSPLTSWKPNSITIDCANEANCTETVVNGVVTEVIMTGQGTYSVDPATNVITFVPVDTFTGIARPVTYSISDARDQVSSTTYTPTVIAPPVPTATPDTVELLPGQSKVFSSIFDGQTGDNDPALATKGAGAPDLTNSTVCIIDPATSVCDTDGIVTIAGQGTYTLNPTTGIVTYAALSTATPGAKTPVTYKITDDLGRSVTSTLTPTITPPPVANPDFSTGVQGAIQTLSPVGNDRPGGGASSELFPDTRAQIPSGIFLCAANEPPPDCAASTVTVTDPVTGVTLGVLTVAASGLVTFTPEPNFIGTTPPIGYQLPDNLGQKAYSTITITVLPPPAPSATTDTGSAQYNNPVTLKPWINDAAGAVPAGSSAPAPKLIATSIRLCDDNSTFVAMSGAPADCTAMKVKTIEGTYEVNATTGEVVFTPVDGFIGTVKYPPTYQIWTDWAGAGGAKSATALLVPTIAPPGAPAAEVDVTKTKPGTSVVLNPVGNDIPGTAVLDPTSIRLCGSDETAPDCTMMKATTLDGTYVVNPTTGEVTFTPRAGFTGEATIPYIIKDAMGMIAASHLIITVEDIEIVPVVAKEKVGLAKTGGARPDLLLLLGLVALAGAGGLRVLGRKK